MPPDPLPSRSIVVIAGPTGVGKSEIALRLAPLIGGEIVNCDSVQIYRGFDIGSAKPDRAARAAVPHHLFDAVEPDAEFNAADYAALAAAVCEDVLARGGTPILVGGTGFYLRALLAGLPPMPGRSEEVRERIRRIARSPKGRERLHRRLARVDPESASRIAPADRHRIERALEVWLLTGRPISSWRFESESSPPRFHAVSFAITLPRPLLLETLDRRVDLMYEGGLVAEASRLLARYPRASRPFGAIGYREAVRVVDGELTPDEAILETKRRTRAYSKRQMTWLRGQPGLHWIERGPDPLQAVASIAQVLERNRLIR